MPEELIPPINLLQDVIIIGFVCGLPSCLPHTSSYWAVAWLERRMTGFFYFSSQKTHEETISVTHFLSKCKFVLKLLG
jgi:hypothetical protein